MWTPSYTTRYNSTTGDPMVHAPGPVQQEERAMSDRYQSLIHTPVGQLLAKNLGLPNPVRLERYTAGAPLVDGTVVVGGDVHELDGAAAADLLAERAGEALEGALRDPLGTVHRLRRRAEHDDARAGAEAAHQRREELLKGDQPLAGGDPGGVEDETLVALPAGLDGPGVPDVCDAQGVERGDE